MTHPSDAPAPRIPLFLASLTPADLRRQLPWVLLTAVLCAAVSVAFLEALHLAEKFLSPEAQLPWWHVLVMGGVGLAVALISRWVGSPGNVELLVDNIHVMGGQVRRGEWKSLIPISILCIASGGAAGPEAPLVQTTGDLGTRLAEKRNMSTHDRRTLTIVGMAAGFTALFGAPLGGSIFALEILHRRGMEYYEALLPALIGSLCGYLVFMLATGAGLAPVWEFPAVGTLSPVDFLWAAGAGVAGAAVALGFEWMVRGSSFVFGLLPVFWRPVAGGLVLGLLGVVTPYALTFGEAQLGELTTGKWVVGALLLAAGAKFVGTAVTVTSGWRGGFIIPLFFMGAALAQAAHVAFPHSHAVVLITAMMVATNTGVTKTPLGSTLAVTRMGGLVLLPTTLLAAIVSLLLSSSFGLIHSQREREHPAPAAE